MNQEYISKLKNGNTPYYATKQDVRKVITDFDNFPYQRFYRGVYNNPKPIIIEREAGYRKQENLCYKEKIITKPVYPKHCFEGPSSVVYPCYPDYLRKYSDKEEMEIMLNRVCVDRSI
jgi:hypothetical protein